VLRHYAANGSAFGVMWIGTKSGHGLNQAMDGLFTALMGLISIERIHFDYEHIINWA